MFVSSGFTDLPLNDQMRLLQVSWAEILTLTLAFRSIPFNGRLYFATDFWLDERSAKECGATELFNHVRETFCLKFKKDLTINL